MFARATRRIAAVALAGALLAGCTPTPEPTPTPTVLSDEEAFAAAEATYRAYVDALNDVDLSDPETFEPVYALTTGDLNAQDRETFSAWHAEGVSIEGSSSIESVDLGHVQRTEDSTTVEIDACFDVSDVRVTAADGSSLIDDSRPAVQPLRILVTMPSSGVPPQLAAIEPSPDLAC